MTLWRVRNKSRIRIQKEGKAPKRAMTAMKSQGKTIQVEVLDPTKAPKRNRHRINVEEFTAARADVKQQGADWS